MILAEAGGPRRYETSKSLVKHAGLSPADTSSGAFEGTSRISRRGRPGRGPRPGGRSPRCCCTTPSWPRSTRPWSVPPRTPPALRPRRPGRVRAGRPGRPRRPAARARARVACAAALLRWICFMTVHDAAWDPAAASGGRIAPGPWRRQPDQPKPSESTRATGLKGHLLQAGRASPRTRRRQRPRPEPWAALPGPRDFPQARLTLSGQAAARGRARLSYVGTGRPGQSAARTAADAARAAAAAQSPPRPAASQPGAKPQIKPSSHHNRQPFRHH